MAKITKSQWEFGELFPPEKPARNVLTVSQLTAQIRRLLEKQIGRAWVAGEITNLRVQSSGHIYFSLKDSSAQLSCVLFRGEAQVDRSLLQDGRSILVQGELTVYEPRGQYQFRVTSIEPQGVGALQIAFERLKQKLHAEGLFAPERKRPLKRFQNRIGIVTSLTGAALRDVLHVVERRNPALEILLVSCRVQGQGAALEIAAAIRLLNQYSASRMAVGAVSEALDCILLTRGGGSLEDLWAFNEESVARAIYESGVPVISAVGHEIDFTISDFVADVRAATPSAAAEILTEGVFSSCAFLARVSSRLGQLAKAHIADQRYQLEQTAQRLARLHPRRRLNDQLQRLDDLTSTLRRCARHGLRQHYSAALSLIARLGRLRPTTVLAQRKEVLGLAMARLTEQARHALSERHNRLQYLLAQLRLLGPEQVLARGYSITTEVSTGKVLRSAEGIPAGTRLKTTLAKGHLLSLTENPEGSRGR